MARRQIRYAVVGLGHIAQVAILPAFANARRNSRLAAIVSGNEATFPKFVYVSSRRGIPAEANVIGFSMFVIAVALVVGAQLVRNARSSTSKE